MRLRKLSLIGFISAALCLAGSPALALAFCPLLHEHTTHSCCPTHHQQPTSAPCKVDCAVRATPAIAAKVAPARSLVLVPVAVPQPAAFTCSGPSHSAPVVLFDSSGIWLSDRVIRI